MKITQHKIDGLFLNETPNKGGRITPRFIVMHYTCGWSAEGSVSWLTDKDSKVSAHIVIGRDGEITQLAPFNIKTWHAGPSAYAGYRNLNSYSIGIELDNAGWMTEISQGEYLWSNGKRVDSGKAATMDLIQGHHKNISSVEDKYWMVYSDAQMDALDELTDALLKAYPTIEFIVGHDEVDTRGWKTDPGPAFPMEHYKKKVVSRGDEQEEQYQVNVNSLNVRGGPGIQFDKLSEGPLRSGTVVKLLEQKGAWMYVEFNTHNRGWVHGRYVKRVGTD
jgi:N-acetylmuramoyl-L-alanine amidase